MKTIGKYQLDMAHKTTGGTMKTIWKYQLDMAHKTTMNMPQDATVLQFQNQGDRMTFWAIVDTESPMEERVFHVVGTGKLLPYVTGGLVYCGTVQARSYVWHIFEEVDYVWHIFEEVDDECWAFARTTMPDERRDGTSDDEGAQNADAKASEADPARGFGMGC